MSHHIFLVFLIFLIMSPSFTQSQVPAEGNSSAENWVIVGALSVWVWVLVLGLVLLMAYLFLVKPRQMEGTNRSCRIIDVYAVDLNEDEILNSINQENLIRHGASANVYRVQLLCGKKAAVKQLFRSRTGIRLPEFDAELDFLTRGIGHVNNVVQLYRSFTTEVSDLLVYEYLPNGSLWDRLHTNQTTVMDWNVRYEIAVRIANALAYLHHHCNYQVIHGDVKSSNILFDEQMKPKLADLGVAKLMQRNEDINSPEGDVYNFGVVLMELLEIKPSRSLTKETK